jgi:MurNAc alpha-1-phosphate uridylyltransferase
MTPASAMIFAAGFGTRMGDLTRTVPKPLLPLQGRPMIDHSIDILRAAGISNIVANTHYLSQKIAPHLHAQKITVVEEDPILETGGGLRAALPQLGDDPVITMNPDAAWKGPNPVDALVKAWRPDMQALLLLVPLNRAFATGPNGDFSLSSGEIQRGGDLRYTGLQIIKTDRLHEIPDDAFSLNAYWDLLLVSGPLHGVAYDGTWCDIGHPDGLRQAEAMLDQ